ncbi:MAG: phosphatase PAP2 family protein [Myxococcota bacterium]
MKHLDWALFLWINEGLSGPVATWMFGAITWLGNAVVLAVLMLPPMAKWDRTRLRQHFWPMVLSMAATGILVNAAKPVIGRLRPATWAASEGIAVHVPFGIPEDKAFPSGHAQTAFAAAVYLSLLYPKGAPVFLLLAILVGISRIALGVHYPSDVVVGAAVGAAGSWAAYTWGRRRAQRKKATEGVA